LKASSATFAGPNAPTGTPDDARRSASSPTRADPSSGVAVTKAEGPTGGYPLAGPSDLPDLRTHAYRADLADATLAGRVIASHYAEPLERRLARAAELLAAPEDGAEVLASLGAGDALSMLDNSRGWAWGYAGEQRLVGYVRSDAVERG
jgi:hypothetical protein